MRAIPDDNLCYPVVIDLANGQYGSGFFANSNVALYLVTAKHVLVDDKGQLLDKSAIAKVTAGDLATRVGVALDLQKLYDGGKILAHTTRDVAIIQIGERAQTQLVGSDGVQFVGFVPNCGGIKGANLAAFCKFADVLVSNDVFIFGYPRSLGMRGQLDQERPLLRKGIVADKDPNKMQIVIDCPVYQGNSGGLVMQIEDVDLVTTVGRPIGVVTAFVPFIELLESKHYGTQNTNIENAGYAIVTPIDYVLELIGKGDKTVTQASVVPGATVEG